MFLSPGSRAGRRAAAFPAGTRMLFQQSSAPPGWRKDTTHNDKALRIVSGSVGAGGSVAFSTAFGRTATDAHTLTTAEIPAHSHAISVGFSTTANNFVTSLGAAADSTRVTATDGGGGGAHTHDIDLRVLFVDVIIAEKE
jgi:microcystin-dependent protein